MGDELPPQRIGLCFSGGGFRASFFALGVLRYLAEASVADRVAAVSAVSGGRIGGAAAAVGWGAFRAAGGAAAACLGAIAEPFRSVVTTKNVRRRWILGSVLAVVPF